MRLAAAPRYRNFAALLLLLLVSDFALAQVAPSPVAPNLMDMHWNEGAKNCKASALPPLEQHAFNAQTIILRENLCATFEAPFMYLLIGSKKALLIDTGDVGDANKMPLATTGARVFCPATGRRSCRCLWSTRIGISTTAPATRSLPIYPTSRSSATTSASVRSLLSLYSTGLTERRRSISATASSMCCQRPAITRLEIVSFYDRNTALFFAGDFLMPARLLIDDTRADLASARRAAAFVKDRPVSYVLGGRIEIDATGKTFEWESQYHPNEHALAMSKDDVLALPAAVERFNCFYSTVTRPADVGHL